MAQRTEKEEIEFTVVPENISLCVKCGVASATNNLCQKCLNATAATASSGSRPFRSIRSSPERCNPGETRLDLNSTTSNASPSTRREVNRCCGCRRKVGLTGFRCRCGELFCAEHRYSDRHDCSYDYKSAGRDAIARENPVVKAAKIVKI